MARPAACLVRLGASTDPRSHDDGALAGGPAHGTGQLTKEDQGAAAQAASRSAHLLVCTESAARGVAAAALRIEHGGVEGCFLPGRYGASARGNGQQDSVSAASAAVPTGSRPSTSSQLAVGPLGGRETELGVLYRAQVALAVSGRRAQAPQAPSDRMRSAPPPDAQAGWHHRRGGQRRTSSPPSAGNTIHERESASLSFVRLCTGMARRPYT